NTGTNMRKIYNVLNTITGQGLKTVLPDRQSDQILANSFMDFFSSKIEAIANELSSREGVNHDTGELFISEENKLRNFSEIDRTALRRIISRTKKTHCDLDPVHIRELVEAGNFSIYEDLLLAITNKTISSNTFPGLAKRGLIRPFLKGALDRQELGSYRPVTNLSYISKVVENALVDQLKEHLMRIKAIPDNQSAYRRLHSTETVISAVVDDCIGMLDGGECGILILLDLSAAFDTVVHNLLLEDLREVGIEGDALKLMESYLSQRKFQVQIGDSLSEERGLDRGVPQGSVLGPLLFCIYTRKLACLLERLGIKFKLFADDTQIYIVFVGVENTPRKIQEVLLEVKSFMDYKKLKLNESKTEFIALARWGDPLSW
ncbi:MAG: reverse transcriptase family protein, partial [Bacteroidota bacterium]